MTSYHSPDRQSQYSPTMASPKGGSYTSFASSGPTANARGITVAGANTPTRKTHTNAPSGQTTPALSSWYASDGTVGGGSPTFLVGTPMFSPTMQPRPTSRNAAPADLIRNNSPLRAIGSQHAVDHHPRTASPLVAPTAVSSRPSAAGSGILNYKASSNTTSGYPSSQQQHRAATPSGRQSTPTHAAVAKGPSTPSTTRSVVGHTTQYSSTSTVVAAPSATVSTSYRRAATPTGTNPHSKSISQSTMMASTVNGNLSSLLSGAVISSSSPIQSHPLGGGGSRITSPTMAQLASSYSDYDLGSVAATSLSQNQNTPIASSKSGGGGMHGQSVSATYQQGNGINPQLPQHAHSVSNPLTGGTFHYPSNNASITSFVPSDQQQQQLFHVQGVSATVHPSQSLTAPNSGLATPITHTRMSAGSARRTQYINSAFNSSYHAANNNTNQNNTSFNGSFSNSVVSSVLTSPVAKGEGGGNHNGGGGGSVTPLGGMSGELYHNGSTVPYYYHPSNLRPSSASAAFAGTGENRSLHSRVNTEGQGHTTDGSVCSSNGTISHSTGASDSNGALSSNTIYNNFSQHQYHRHQSGSASISNITHQGGAIQQTPSNMTSNDKGAAVGVRRRGSETVTAASTATATGGGFSSAGTSGIIPSIISRGSPVPTPRPMSGTVHNHHQTHQESSSPSATGATNNNAPPPVRYRDVTALDDLLAAATIHQNNNKAQHQGNNTAGYPQQQPPSIPSNQATAVRRETVARLSFNDAGGASPSSPTVMSLSGTTPFNAASSPLKRPPPLPAPLAAAPPTGTSSSAQPPSTPRGTQSGTHHHTSSRQSATQQQQQQQPTSAGPPQQQATSAYASKVVSSTSKALLAQFVHRWASNHQENQACYKENGYLNVKPGMQLQSRYVLIAKLGWGEFSTVWLGYDKRTTEQRNTFVAVKIAKCGQNVTESTKYEIGLLKFLRDTLPTGSPATPLVNAFEHRGDFGIHQCLVMPLCGSNLLCIIDSMKAKKQRRREKELTMLKEITISILQGLVDLEAENIIHTDLKPENILCANPDPKIVNLIQSFIQRNAENIKNIDTSVPVQLGDPSHLVNLADFGLSVLVEPQPSQSNDPRAVAAANTPRAKAIQEVGLKRSFRVSKSGVVSNSNGVLIQTREYRAPEILLGCDFNPRTDVWSVGCIVYELITGDFLLDPKRRTSVEREMDIEHLAMIMQILGPVPPRIAAAAKGGNAARAPRYLGRYFSEDGVFLYADKYRNYPRRSLAAELEQFLEPSEAERAAQFIMSCFTYDPMERPHAADLLKHSWLRIPSSSQ